MEPAARRATLDVVIVRFEDVEIDLSVFELRRAGRAVAIEPQAFEVLAHLARNRDRLVSKEELMDTVWGGRFVTETAVSSRIKQIRRAVGDDGVAQRVIKTVHGRGYRFCAAVTDDAPARPAVVPPSAGRAPVRYAQSDDLQIAYQVTGGGPRDIVLVAGFVSHLELDWAEPRHAHFLDRLGTFGRLIRFDKRGTGLSDRPSGLPDLETRMHDVQAVMAAAGSTRAVLVGYSEGGPMSVLFAASHPGMVEALVLYGSYARRLRTPDYPWAPTPEQREVYGEQLSSQWSWENDMRTMCPSADDAMARWWGQRARASATPSTVRALVAMNTLVDVRDLLPAVRVPTLVLHRTDDRDSRVEEGRYIATHIPGAEFVELSGADHFVAVDPDQILEPVERFLSALPDESAPASALAAVLAVSGPAAEEAAGSLASRGGRPRRTPDGTPVVLYDGPATAIRSATAYLDSALAGEVGLGLHIGEVPRSDEPVRGPGADVSTVLAAAAPMGQLWTSITVRDLIGGSDLVLEPVMAAPGGHPAFRPRR